MGNSISHKTRYALTFLCFILLVLFTLFLFTKRTLEPYLSFYQPSFQIHSSNDAFIDDNQTLDTAPKNRETCDLYTGTWVKDDDYPIYKPGSCPYVDEAFDCQSNGRPDSDYLRWRWKPDGCDLPRYALSFIFDHMLLKLLMLCQVLQLLLGAGLIPIIIYLLFIF